MKSFQAVIIAAIVASSTAVNEPVASPSAAIERELAESERRLRAETSTRTPPRPPTPSMSYGYVHTDPKSGKAAKKMKMKEGKAVKVSNMSYGMSYGPEEGFSLVLTNEGDIDPSILDSISSAFYSYYPHIVDVYSPDATKKVFLLVNNQTDGWPAWTVEDKVTIRGPYLKDIPTDAAGVTVHELTHVAQQTWKKVPDYFIEGFADFIRDETGVDQAMGNSKNWVLPECYRGGSYKKGYAVTAAFVKWMLANNKFVLEDLISVFRDGTYSDESTWPALTGTGLDDLWGLYTSSAACLPV